MGEGLKDERLSESEGQNYEIFLNPGGILKIKCCSRIFLR